VSLWVPGARRRGRIVLRPLLGAAVLPLHFVLKINRSEPEAMRDHFDDSSRHAHKKTR